MNDIESRKSFKYEGRFVEVSCVNGGGALADLSPEDLKSLVLNTIDCLTLRVGIPFNTTEEQFARIADGRENQLVDKFGLRRAMDVSKGLLRVRLVDLIRGPKEGTDTIEHFQAVTDGSRVIFAGAHGKSPS